MCVLLEKAASIYLLLIYQSKTLRMGGNMALAIVLAIVLKHRRTLDYIIMHTMLEWATIEPRRAKTKRSEVFV